MSQAPDQVRNGDLLRHWWQNRPPAARRRTAVVLALLAAVWVSGAVYAPRVVAGLARLDGAARGLLALSMGGFGWLWGGLKGLGVVTESAESGAAAADSAETVASQDSAETMLPNTAATGTALDSAATSPHPDPKRVENRTTVRRERCFDDRRASSRW